MSHNLNLLELMTDNRCTCIPGLPWSTVHNKSQLTAVADAASIFLPGYERKPERLLSTVTYHIPETVLRVTRVLLQNMQLPLERLGDNQDPEPLQKALVCGLFLNAARRQPDGVTILLV